MAAVPTVAVSPPVTWRQVAPPKLEYELDAVTITVSVVQGLPEDPEEWLRVEVARLAGDRTPTAPAYERVTTSTGWPALIAESTVGTDKLALIMYEFLELGAVATITGPADRFDAHRREVLDVLLAAQVDFDPAVTLHGLLDGASR
jgi:hypothetical protein